MIVLPSKMPAGKPKDSRPDAQRAFTRTVKIETLSKTKGASALGLPPSKRAGYFNPIQLA
jgi:hypothetical protein